jgi:hypothetical protein
MDILTRASRGRQYFVMWWGLLAIFAVGCSNSNSTPTAPCAYTLSNSNISSSAIGGDSAVTVTTTSGCAWSASTNASWIHITSVGSTSGTGVVNFTVDSNSIGSSRTGTLTVANQTVTVTQAAGSQPPPPPPPPQCTYTLSVGATIDGYPSGGSFTVTVTTQSGCGWTASTTASWIHIAGAPGTAGGSFSGIGTGSFIFTVDPNHTGSNRTGTMSIAGQAVTFNQSSTP